MYILIYTFKCINYIHKEKVNYMLHYWYDFVNLVASLVLILHTNLSDYIQGVPRNIDR